jgi:uncharacterized RDD family membrane protein YckC
MLTNSLGQVPRYAGFWMRFAACFIDCMPIAIVLHFINPKLHLNLISWLGLFSLLFYWLYCTVLEASSWQATIGKKLLCLKVTDEEGKRIGFGRANVRFWSKTLLSFLCIGYFMMLFTKKKQCLHDKIARTLVLKAQD